MVGAIAIVAASCTGEPGGQGQPLAGGPGGESTSSSGGSGGSIGATGGTFGGGGVGGVEPPPAGSIPMYVAQGHVGRTIVSCDDGQTWAANRSDDDAIICFIEGFDCDHHSGSAQGITYGDGWFFATFGWGSPGGVRRSRDGVSWETTLNGTTFSGLAFGNDRLVSGDRTPSHSDDAAETWTPGEDSGLSEWTTRRIGFAPSHGGRFILIGDGPELVVSSDGATWSHPTTIPSDCGSGVQTDGGIAFGNGVIVVAGGNGVACRTTDGGATWTSTGFADWAGSQLVFDGSEFMIWGDGEVHRSADGAAWTTTSTVPNDLRLGAVASNGAGTIVGVNGAWEEWYDDQVFYRSTDGVNWQALSQSSFTGSHPIRHIAFGHGQPSGACSAP